MDPVALTAALVAAVVAAVALVVVAVVLLRTTRTTRAQRERLDRELLTSRDEVAELSRRVAELSAEVTETRRAAAEDRDYVITSLTNDAASSDRECAPAHAQSDEAALLPYDDEERRPSVGQLVEDQLVGVLARQDGSRLRARAVGVVVRTVALGHGVRRVLSPDVLDRAAAEAHVARRRSRRDRRRELREARKVVRGARLAEDPDRTPDRREDAA